MSLVDASEEARHDSRSLVTVADHIYEYLLSVIENGGETVRTGIHVLRAIDKVFSAWNQVVEFGTHDAESFRKAARGTVVFDQNCPEARIYHLTGRTFAEIFDVAECSRSGLSEIASGTEAMRGRIQRALDCESRENGKANVIKQIREAAIEHIEDYLGMHQPGESVQLMFDAVKDAPDRADSRAYALWTAEHRLALLEIYSDESIITHDRRADVFNRRFPGMNRSKWGVRHEHTRLRKRGVTIKDLQAEIESEAEAAGMTGAEATTEPRCASTATD